MAEKEQQIVEPEPEPQKRLSKRRGIIEKAGIVLFGLGSAVGVGGVGVMAFESGIPNPTPADIRLANTGIDLTRDGAIGMAAGLGLIVGANAEQPSRGQRKISRA
jgi:hypothetical protein